MNKDIIYIDVEDDITAIIGKIKASKDKIVALVPPKRIGVLQSAVNLQLLARTATTSKKHLVLITNNQALIALTAMAKIPVAKNLQSKPEIAEIAALEVDDGEDIIDGAQLPVGELARTADPVPIDDVAAALGTIDIENEGPLAPKAPLITPQPIRTAPSVSKNNVKVPDFSRFRKKLFLALAIIPFFVAFLVWAIWFAPAAKITITAKTSTAGITRALTLGGTKPTDVPKGIVQTINKQIKKDISVDFTATGKKKMGDKATGTLTLSNADSSDPMNIPLGSVFNDGIYYFATTVVVDVPGAGVVDGSIVPGTIDVAVQATNVGAEYNLPPSDYVSTITGITATGGQMAGGNSHDALVVTADDIQKATQALNALTNDDVKQQLIAEFVNDESVIADSFATSYAKPVSLPALDAEAKDGKAKLTSSATFSIIGIAKSELEAFLKDSVTQQITDPNTQKIYSDGIDNVVFQSYTKTGKTATVYISATGQIGPNIDQAAIKEQVRGKQFGDVQALLSTIKGVDNVDIKFSYFWVNTVPDDVKKIDVQFVLQNG